jgi:hypothetical protein
MVHSLEFTDIVSVALQKSKQEGEENVVADFVGTS